MLIFVVRVYRVLLSPALTTLLGPLGFGCRFYPTCSQYASQAIQDHGAIKGLALATQRLCRCHPWGGSGDDPVPSAGCDARSPLPAALDAKSVVVHRPDLQARAQNVSLGTPSGHSS